MYIMYSFIPIVTVITGSILVHLCIGGFFYSFGNMSPYIISYLKNRTDEHTLRNVDNIWIMNAATVVASVGSSLGGVLDRHLGVRMACTIGCVIFCTGQALTYFTIKHSLVYVSLTYGLLSNIGGSIAYGPPTQNSAKWLPERPTFAVGIIVCGYGGGAFIFNQIITAYINPSNISPGLETEDGQKYFVNKALLDRIPTVFLLLAGIYAAMCTIGITLILPAEAESEGCIPSCSRREMIINDGEENQTPNQPVKDVLKAILKDKNAWLWLFMLLMVFGGMQFANSFYKAYGETFISDDHFLALVGAVSSVFNCTLRPVWGLIMDKYGFKITIKFLSAIFVCLSVTLFVTETMHKIFFLIWICGLYGTYCGVWAIGPSLLGKLFGVENMAIAMGFQMFAVTVGTIAGGFIGMSLQTVIGWHGLFLMAGCMGTTAFFLSFFFDGKDTEGNDI